MGSAGMLLVHVVEDVAVPWRQTLCGASVSRTWPDVVTRLDLLVDADLVTCRGCLAALALEALERAGHG